MTPILPSLLATGAVEAASEFLRKGGVFMIPLALTSVAGLMAICYKFLSLASSRVVPEPLARKIDAFENHAAADRVEPIFNEFAEGRSVLARLAHVAARHRDRPADEITSAVQAAAREETVHLHAGVGVLDVVITVAPLLGLLGTATGLVVIFQGLGETTDHLLIARGIAEALNTTIAGLAIAVPCVIAHSYFTRRIEGHTARLESLLARLVSSLQSLRRNP